MLVGVAEWVHSAEWVRRAPLDDEGEPMSLG
jgi:hypothetical protein